MPGRHHSVVEVLPGAEAAPGARQNHDARVAERFESVAQLLVHGDVEGVELVGPVEGDSGDRPVSLDDDGLEIDHGALPCLIRANGLKRTCRKR